MIDIDKLNTAKLWVEKLANGINPMNDEMVKEDDTINNVHISRCLFYVSELLDKIQINPPKEKTQKEPFFISMKDALSIPIIEPNGINNFVRIVNGYIPAEMKKLTTVQVIKWLRKENILQEISKEDGLKTNLPTTKGIRLGITTEVKINLDGSEYKRVIYSIEAQKFILNNIESVSTF